MKKLYCYTTTIAFGIIINVLMIGLLVPVILFPKETWYLIIGIFILLLVFWFMVGTGQFTPIYLTEKGIKYKGQEFGWDDVWITAYPASRRSFQYGYYLVFGQMYLYGKNLKEQIRRGFWVYLKEKPLKEILKHYNKKIKILSGIENFEGHINSTKKNNAIIQQHNDNVKE